MADPIETDSTEAAGEQAGTEAAGEQAGTEAAGEQGSTEAAGEQSSTERIDRRKVREGLVVSTSMDKTAVVAVIERVRHPRYVKTVQRTKRLYAHDEGDDTRVGDRVRISETRPLSKQKHWRIVEVLERAK